jgi:hypothetical protein
MIPPKKRLLQEPFEQNQREQQIDARLNADDPAASLLLSIRVAK